LALKIDQNRERFRDRTFCRIIRASHPQVHDVERLHSEVLQTDPVSFAAHDINLYRYVFNSPPNLSDPNGTSPVYSDSCASDSDLGKIHTGSLSFATKVYPSGESPTRDAIKKIWDKVKPEGYPDADKIGKAVLGVEQMYGSAGARIEIFVGVSFEVCTCGKKYEWEKQSKGPDSVGDYWVNDPGAAQEMKDDIQGYINNNVP
jgi:hypothetical protein